MLDLSGHEARAVNAHFNKPFPHPVPFSVEQRLVSIVANANHWTPHITTVNLSYTSVVNIFNLLSRCPQLRDLDISNCVNIDHNAFASLVLAPRLKKLNVAGCEQVDDFAIEFLPRTAPGLEELNLSALPNITHACLPSVVQLTELRILDLSDSLGVDDWTPLIHENFPLKFQHILPTLPPTSNLRCLALPGNEEVTDAQILILSSLHPNLDHLTLFVGDSSEFNGRSLDILLEQCSTLRSLDLAISSEPALLTALPTLRLLTSLALDVCYGAFSDETVRLVAANAPGLTSLSFYNNPEEHTESDQDDGVAPVYRITDETMKALVDGCPKLKKLQVFCDKLSSEGLKMLTMFPDMTHLVGFIYLFLQCVSSWPYVFRQYHNCHHSFLIIILLFPTQDLTNPHLTAPVLRHLSENLPQLTHLVLMNPSKHTPETKLHRLFEKRLGLQLRHLVLFLDAFTDDDLKRLGPLCPSLTHLELNTYWNFPLTLEHVARHCVGLRSLKLGQGKRFYLLHGLIN